jgi:hypothetical protein
MSTTRNRRGPGRPRKEATPIGAVTRSFDKNEFPADTWVVYRGTGDRKALLFPGNLSRDSVRVAYSKETGVHHDVTRSRRLKNYWKRGK